ncbi:MFS transporter [Natranaeroarchaeum sulfidigenes]|uniref:MFS family permease n=1 Tax=Natranaeroarchaeum sulfidigenes TaxID=2784880 RepID=A0A897MN68_9EURY|nr:MFS transporter [Natranaeroarchaeum sulfidigenes]QSG02007.1 MFS family permease [Natranaeroarchaeum sulfidigenes]
MARLSLRTSLKTLDEFDALVLVSLLWFLAKFVRYAFPPLFEPLQGVYGVTNAEIGFAYTGFMLTYAAMQFPSGALADRFGSVRVIATGSMVAALAALALVIDSPFAVLVGAMVLMGAGTGAHKTVAIRLLSRLYPARTGRALGTMDTIGTFAGVVAPAVVVAVLAGPALLGESWRTVFLVAGLAGVAGTVAFTLRVSDPDGTDSAGASGGTVREYVTLFRSPRLLAFVLVTVLFGFTYNGVVAFLPLYLTSEAGLTPATASLLFAALFAASVVQVVSGTLSDRVGELPVIVATLALATTALAALVVLTPTGRPLVLGAVVVVIGLGSHGFRPVRGAYWMSVLPESLAGGSLGIVRTLLMGSGALAPAVVGVLSESVGFVPTFWVLTATIACSATLAAVLLFTR